jgi:hypothetical protein
MSEQSAESRTLMPCREKYWAELADAEKIERLRQIIKQLEYRLRDTAKTANDAHRIAEDHQHGSRGKVLMPINAFNREVGGQVGAIRDEKYF